VPYWGDPHNTWIRNLAVLSIRGRFRHTLMKIWARAEPAKIDVAALQARFAPVLAQMPDVVVNLPPIASYDLLLPSLGVGA